MKRCLISLTLAILALSAVLVGCNKTPAPTQLEVIKLSEQMRVDELYNDAGDTLFFGVIKSMACFDNDVLILCQEPKQLIRLDSELRFKNVVARQGRAGYEYIDVSTICHDNGAILIGDYSKSGFMKFSPDGKHIETFDIGSINTMTDIKQSVRDGILYTNHIDLDANTRFASIDLKKGSRIQHGTITQYGGQFRTMIRNLAYTFTYGNDIITLESEHIVARYNKNWKLVEKLDLRSIPEVDKLIRDDELENSNGNSANVNVFDACVGGNYMYIIFQSIAWKGERTKILAINLKNKISIDKYYILEGDRYFRFCADNKYIYACPADGGEIVKYRLE